MVPFAYIAMLALAVALNVVLPALIAWAARRRLGLPARYILYGALIFTLFQLISRVPVVFALQAALAPQLAASPALQVGWLAGLALSAGLFEEVGRYIGYRWLMRDDEKTWGKAVLYGLGHGGVEAIVLVGGLGALTLVNLVALATVDPAALRLTAEQQSVAAQQLAAIAAQPAWLPLASVWERLWSIAFHVAMSVVVLQSFVRPGGRRWVLLAVALHALTNFVAIGLPLLLGAQGTAGVLLSEAIVALCGGCGLLAAWRLRRPPA